MLSVCQNYVVSHELQITTKTSKSRCLKSVFSWVNLRTEWCFCTWIGFVHEKCQSLLLFPLFLSLFSVVPLKFSAGNYCTVGQIWSRRACPTFARMYVLRKCGCVQRTDFQSSLEPSFCLEMLFIILALIRKMKG